MTNPQPFQAEIKQLLNILVHSLYQDREIFLRELVSNASDALNRVQFQMLTDDNILDADAELRIDIVADPETKTITITDTGIGMTADEMVDSLGVIARSGARSFLDTMGDEADATVSDDIIGQFGIGFYSVFMVADRVEVTSRSADPDAEAMMWVSSGEDSYEILPAEMETRGTTITVYLRDDAEEFASRFRLREIVKKHSDFVQFPIFLADPVVEAEEIDENEEADEDAEAAEPEAPTPVNAQTAIWRRSSSEIEDEEYSNFYRSLTLDFAEPSIRIHSVGDAPIQYYALLFIPASNEQNMFSPRKDPGLKLYARKVLIQEYTTDLLPEYLNFVQGVVDSEDLPLNVSRETVQDNPFIGKLGSIITRRILKDLAKKAKKDVEGYADFWSEFGPFIKHGVATVPTDRDRLLPLLRFYSNESEDTLVSLEAYVANLAEGQDKIYYLTADSLDAAARSLHLDAFRERGLEVLYMVDTIDGFLLPALGKYEDLEFVSVDSADLDLDGVGDTPEESDDESEAVSETASDGLITYITAELGEAVEEVRVSKVLSGGNPARLVVPEGSMDRHQQRLYQMLDKEYDVPTLILEINAKHPIIKNLVARLEGGLDDEATRQAVSLLYQNALLADGIHPNPAEMVEMIHSLIEKATKVD